jgi:DNA-binding protein H-NS
MQCYGYVTKIYRYFNFLMEIHIFSFVYCKNRITVEKTMVGQSAEIDFREMTVNELWQLLEDLSHILSVRLTAQIRELERRLIHLRHDAKIRPSESASEMAAPRERRAYPRIFPKYQNPHEPSETWSGRGKRPRWLKAALKTGRAIEEFVIRKGEPDQSLARRRA